MDLTLVLIWSLTVLLCIVGIFVYALVKHVLPRRRMHKRRQAHVIARRGARNRRDRLSSG
jgi:hypothetical protein